MSLSFCNQDRRVLCPSIVTLSLPAAHVTITAGVNLMQQDVLSNTATLPGVY